MAKHNLYVIAGCNGAGKTTASYTLLPDILDCQEFINADEIARGLSPFKPEKAAIKAGRIMLNSIKELINAKADFAFETTLSTRSYANLVKKAQDNGYFVTLVFFWLNSVSLAKERVRIRVKEGGHFIDNETIVRRYTNGIKNLVNIYSDIVDYWIIIDNSDTPSDLIAEGDKLKSRKIYNPISWNKIIDHAK